MAQSALEKHVVKGGTSPKIFVTIEIIVIVENGIETIVREAIVSNNEIVMTDRVTDETMIAGIVEDRRRKHLKINAMSSELRPIYHLVWLNWTIAIKFRNPRILKLMKEERHQHKLKRVLHLFNNNSSSKWVEHLGKNQEVCLHPDLRAPWLRWRWPIQP
jgi:hypothetical protein